MKNIVANGLQRYLIKGLVVESFAMFLAILYATLYSIVAEEGKLPWFEQHVYNFKNVFR